MHCEYEYGYSFPPGSGELVNQWHDSSNNTENKGCLSMPVKQSLVLDGEKGELVKASVKVGKRNGDSSTKTVEALRSHSEAERRRRERINANLASLRGLIPNNEKLMDKASLLAEAITQIKQLRKSASQASEGLHIPMDSDEVKVETLENRNVDGSFVLKALLCCEHWPDLLSDLRQVMSNLKVRILKSEISTLGSRVKVVFLIETAEGDGASRVHEAFSKVLEKVSALAESAEQLFIPRKRQRVSCIDSLPHFFA